MLALFDDLVLVATDGRIRSDYPMVVGRTNVNIADREYFKRAMENGPLISDPLRGKQFGEPIVVMAVPILGRDGQVRALLVGTIRLMRDNVLGNIASTKVGRTGYLFVLTGGDKPVYVAYPDKSRVLAERPANASQEITHALATGFEGTLEGTNSSGLKALFSYHRLRSTGWTVVSVLPTEEAFAPIAKAGRRTRSIALVTALLMVPLVWLAALKMLAPLTSLVARINRLREATGGGDPAEVNEFAILVGAFDGLMAERARAETRWREGEARIRGITDNLPALVCYIDHDHRFTFNNHSYERWLNKPLSEITGRPVLEVYGPEVYERLRPDLEKALAGEHASFEVEFPGRDGRIHYARGKYRPDVDESGKVCGIYGLITDVTQLKEAEDLLLEERSRMANILEGTNAGTWEWNIKTGEIRVNERWAGMIGYTLDELGPTTIDLWVAHTDPCDVRGSREQLKTFFAGDAEHNEYEARMRHRDGTWIWVQNCGRISARDADGNPLWMHGVSLDVTARKEMERQLAENRQLLQTTLDSIADAVITTDTDGCVRWLNPIAERMTGWAKGEARGQPLRKIFVIIDDGTQSAAADPVAACIAQGTIVSSTSGTTLLSRNGSEYGIEDSASPIRDAAGALFGVVLVFRDVSEQRRLSQEMTHRATHDPLTGLANRIEFETRLQRALDVARSDERMTALLYIDLDQFKVVNDACGHAVGDRLLQQVSKMLRDSVRGRDTVARLGGDEFGIILEHCPMDQAQRIAQKMCDLMEQFRFMHDGRAFPVGTSIGLVPLDDRWESIVPAMQAADASCYAAKEAGRNRVHVWVDSDGAMQTRHGETQWVSRIGQALDENRFELYAQRIVPIGASIAKPHLEILLRLVETDGSIVAPGAFLPAAERFNMATRIDRWVVREVFDRLTKNPAFTSDIGMISVNLSGNSVGDRAFHRDVVKWVREAQFDVRKLCFEITETAAITNFVDAKKFVDEVRFMGVRIALDDFGAGASSFSYLKTLPVDYLKIDGQFIRHLLSDTLDDAAVRCFKDVARVVGVKTIAEFVETEEVHTILTDIGIDLAQGYLLHRPEPFVNFMPVVLETA